MQREDQSAQTWLECHWSTIYTVHPVIPPFVWKPLTTLPKPGETHVMVKLALLVLLAFNPSFEIRDVNGRPYKPFLVEEKAQILFFLSSDCPISRFYAPEIQRICAEYRAHGVRCGLVYEDRPVNAAAIRAHLDEFGYRGIPAVSDTTGKIAAQVNAIVTPEAVVIDRIGRIRYRGRIDNFYADLGKPRRTATVHDLRDAVDAVVAGRVVTHSETTSVGCFIMSPDLFPDPYKEKK
jgi:thiol-disulfide isomerase/thioredoxin